jgi:hypothetical protein
MTERTMQERADPLEDARTFYYDNTTVSLDADTRQEVITMMASFAAAARDDGKRALTFVQMFADEPCSYGDNCTPEAMDQRRHYQCRNCQARDILQAKPAGAR